MRVQKSWVQTSASAHFWKNWWLDHNRLFQMLKSTSINKDLRSSFRFREGLPAGEWFGCHVSQTNHCSIMPTRHRPLSEDLRWVLVRMARSMSIPQILAHTGLKRRTIEHILSTYRCTGRVLNSPKKPRGRKPILDSDDAAVCFHHCYNDWG
jgi:hypothetical protein